MKNKHRNDYNHGKNGWVGGNPRYRGKGFQKGDRAKQKVQNVAKTRLQEQSIRTTKVTND